MGIDIINEMKENIELAGRLSTGRTDGKVLGDNIKVGSDFFRDELSRQYLESNIKI